MERSTPIPHDRLADAADAIVNVLFEISGGALPMISSQCIEPVRQSSSLDDFTDAELREAEAFLVRLGLLGSVDHRMRFDD
ncbi:MAG: hypothetical protein AAFX05_13240 [Planctomycetota bacterium]